MKMFIGAFPFADDYERLREAGKASDFFNIDLVSPSKTYSTKNFVEETYDSPHRLKFWWCKPTRAALRRMEDSYFSLHFQNDLQYSSVGFTLPKVELLSMTRHGVFNKKYEVIVKAHPHYGSSLISYVWTDG